MTNTYAAEARRVNAGFQCPECYGVQIRLRLSGFSSKPDGFLCTDCGCQWDEHRANVAGEHP